MSTQITEWDQVPSAVDDWTLKTAAPARDIKRELVHAYTKQDAGIYWNPRLEKAAVFSRTALDNRDSALCKLALDRAVGQTRVSRDPLSYADLEQDWVKVAYSPTVRRAGELGNFFPGDFVGGYPNKPSPLAAMLTGGLVGAGIGYGTGQLGAAVMPSSWDTSKLKQTMTALGGLLGSVPGAAWSYSAAKRGRSLLDGKDMTENRLIDASDLPDVLSKQSTDGLGQQYLQAARNFAKQAYDMQGGFRTMGGPAGSIDVNINKMGQTLWEVGAGPRTTATTLGALYAASQLPDPHARAGHVTPHQTGMLGTMLGAAGGGVKGYAAGYLAGKALNVLTGAPVSVQNTLKRTGAALGVINTVVPRLFQ